MERSYLIQRLNQPYRGNHVLGKTNPFAFGGGLKNGGLSDEAMGMLADVFQFDYMGCAEFEWGAVPEALQKMAKMQLGATSFTIPLTEVQKDWRDKNDKEPEGEGTIYVIGQTADLPEIETRIRAWAKDDHYSEDGRRCLLEPTRLASTLRPASEYDGRTVGWLELDNGFAFFTDERMWRETAQIFGLPV